MRPEDFKNLTEGIAIIVGGVYFLYRSGRGSFTHNLSLSLDCSRKANPTADRDYLAVTVKISKGERYTVELHDAKVRVNDVILPLNEVYRKHTKPEKLEAKDRKGKVMQGEFIERRVIDFAQNAWLAPFLRLAPGDQTQLSCWLDVPHAAICTLEVVVVGKRVWPSWIQRTRPFSWWYARGPGRKVGQWRASAISLLL